MISMTAYITNKETITSNIVSKPNLNVSITSVGQKGDKGEDGTDSDKTFILPFTNLSTVQVAHNLNKLPSVTVINSANDEVSGDVTYNDYNNLTLHFTSSFTGTVTCN